jgi:hypothetical protein
MAETDSPRPLLGDRPIESAADDSINRTGFALQIRTEIEAAPRDEGLVLAVTGEWGSGKTSVINMAVAPLEEQPGYRIVRFNPWLFSGTPQLVEHFFGEVMAELNATGNRRVKEIGEALERYGSAVDPLRFIPGADKAAALTTSLGRLLRGRTVGVRRQKENLDRLLAKHDELIVVVLDDIDRLHDQEVADVMRLVRLVADFPNMVYILAFDEDRVAQAINASDVETGRTYIEKIVQVGHEVPAILGEQLSDLLLARLNAALQGSPYRLDQAHWSRLFLIFRNYFETPRHVARYCNQIRAPIRLVATEIEAADILTLEALRLFERGFWRELPRLQNELTNVTGDADLFGSRPAPDAQRLKDLVESAQRPEVLNEVIRALFPAAAQHLGGQRYGTSEPLSWQHQRRVAAASVLQIYLSKQVAPTSAPTPVVERTVSLLEDAQELRRELSTLSSPQLADLLGRLELYEGTFPESVGPAIRVLYEVTPRLPRREGMFDIEPNMRVARVILRMLRGRSEPDVAAIVSEALPDLQSLSDRWALIRLVGHRPETGHALVKEDDAARWETELIDAIVGASPALLSAEPDLASLLFLASSARPDETRSVVREAASRDDVLIRLITAYRHEVQSERGRRLQLSWDRLKDLLGEDLLVRRIGELGDLDSGTDGDTRQLVEQARRYAADPEFADRELEEYRQRYP